MSFAVDNLADSFNRINFNSPHQAWLAENQSRNNRNLQCMPSDDEEEDEEVYSSDNNSDQESLKKSKKVALTSNKVKSNIPLPSDEEDNTDDEVEEEEDDEDDDVLLPISYNNAMKRTTHGALPFRNNRSAPSLPQQLEQQQQQQQQHADSSTNRITEGNHRSISTDNLSRLIKQEDEDDEVIGQHLKHVDATPHPTMHQYHQYQQQKQQQQHQQQLAQFQYLKHQQYNPMQTNRNQKQQQQLRMTTMSGMDLLIQREQEKAEAKRQKPKLNTSKVKIEGLLGKLPEPGTHNINFQQIQQQYMSPIPTSSSTQKKHSNRQQQQVYGGYVPQLQQQQVSYGYMPTPPSMTDYYNNGRSSVPPINNNVMYGQPSSFYQMPNYMSNTSLCMMTNQQQHQPPPMTRPSSTMNQTKQRSTTPISFSQH